jgi:signal transduction histidine kinase
VEPIADENNNGLLSEKVVIKRRLGEVVFKVRTVKVTDDKGADIGVMKIFNDVTREQNLDRMKSEFISIAAHQLRTPLSSIKWVIKMVLSGDAGDLNEEQAELLDKGYKSNERMIGLVNDMLDVSRIEEGRFGYDFAVENFTETLDIIIETLSSQISEKHIKFKVDKPKKLPKVEMDKKKMSLVLQNLLENAVKYTPEYGRIEVILEPGEKFLRVRVKDNGVGIPAEDQAKLFSKFFRANNVIRMQTEGSGLGLFIVKNIIQKHGGDITFTSEEGKGTEFAFTLPFKAPENN